MEQSHEALVQGGYGALQGQPLFRKLAAIYAEEANKTSRIKVNAFSRRNLIFLYFNGIFMCFKDWNNILIYCGKMSILSKSVIFYSILKTKLSFLSV